MAEGLPSEAVIGALVLKAQGGDTEAFGKVYDHFFDSVYRYVSFRVPSEMTEDIVADIFVKAWEKLHQYSARKGVPFGAWIFRIARHAVIDHYRSDEALEEVPEEIVDTDQWNRAESRTERNDLLKVVRSAFDQLTPRYREVLSLSFIAELPTNEVARVLKMTEGGVRILKMRALRKLQDFLPPDFQK
jgi:RNA polymerase sigma-70 factor (ECF subfamily)